MEGRAITLTLAPVRGSMPGSNVWSGLVAHSVEMTRVRDTATKFAASSAPVLLTGESGTGKEVVARAIHESSARSMEALVSVNCAGLPEALLEAELFGHEKGAFTGAQHRRDGRFKAADHGTLFLDEIGEMPLASQAKLLRVLQEGSFEPLGTNRTVRVDVRVLSATNCNLRDRIAAGLFREDLYYRLNVLPLHIPPLRERRADILPLVGAFLARHSPGTPPTISARALAVLTSAELPGNARELEHALQHAIALSGEGEIDVPHLPAEVAGNAGPIRDAAQGFLRLDDAIQAFEREHITQALRLTGGRRIETAKLLGISRKNLWQKMRALGFCLDRP